MQSLLHITFNILSVADWNTLYTNYTDDFILDICNSISNTQYSNLTQAAIKLNNHCLFIFITNNFGTTVKDVIDFIYATQQKDKTLLSLISNGFNIHNNQQLFEFMLRKHDFECINIMFDNGFNTDIESDIVIHNMMWYIPYYHKLDSNRKLYPDLKLLEHKVRISQILFSTRLFNKLSVKVISDIATTRNIYNILTDKNKTIIDSVFVNKLFQ